MPIPYINILMLFNNNNSINYNLEMSQDAPIRTGSMKSVFWFGFGSGYWKWGKLLVKE